MGKRKGKTIRARCFEVVDERGEVCATLEADDQGPGLRLWNHGSAVAVVAVDDDGTGFVVVAAADGTPVQSLGAR